MSPTSKQGETERVAELEMENQRLKQAVVQLQSEVAEVRDRTNCELAAAQDRLYYMDENHLGPEMFERRAYMRFLVRALAALRLAAARMRRMTRD